MLVRSVAFKIKHAASIICTIVCIVLKGEFGIFIVYTPVCKVQLSLAVKQISTRQLCVHIVKFVIRFTHAPVTMPIALIIGQTVF